MKTTLPELAHPAHAFFIPNLTKAVFGEEPAKVLVVTVLAVSIVRPLARIRFASGGIKWVPFDTLSSSRDKLTFKLNLISSAKNGVPHSTV